MNATTTPDNQPASNEAERKAGFAAPSVSPELEFYAVRLYIHQNGFWLTIGEAMSHNSGKSWALLQCGRTETGWELRLLG